LFGVRKNEQVGISLTAWLYDILRKMEVLWERKRKMGKKCNKVVKLWLKWGSFELTSTCG
jgi:hypothetical protein